jgi:hypothetical protein
MAKHAQFFRAAFAMSHAGFTPSLDAWERTLATSYTNRPKLRWQRLHGLPLVSWARSRIAERLLSYCVRQCPRARCAGPDLALFGKLANGLLPFLWSPNVVRIAIPQLVNDPEANKPRQ